MPTNIDFLLACATHIIQNNSDCTKNVLEYYEYLDFKWLL